MQGRHQNDGILLSCLLPNMRRKLPLWPDQAGLLCSQGKRQSRQLLPKCRADPPLPPPRHSGEEEGRTIPRDLHTDGSNAKEVMPRTGRWQRRAILVLGRPRHGLPSFLQLSLAGSFLLGTMGGVGSQEEEPHGGAREVEKGPANLGKPSSVQPGWSPSVGCVVMPAP